MFKDIKKVLKYMLGLAWKERPSLYLAYLLFFMIKFVRNAVAVLLPKLIIDQLVYIYNGADAKEHLIRVLIYAGATVIIEFLANVMERLAERVRSLCDEWFNEYFQVKVNDMAMSVDFECTEDPEVLNQMHKAKEGMSWYSGNVCGILNQFFEIISNVAVLAGVITVICISSPLILPLEIVSMFFIAIFNRKIQQIEIKSFQGLAKSNRIFGYYFFDLSDFQNGKDIRLYQSAELFEKRSREQLDEQEKIWIYQAEGTRKQQLCINVIYALGNFGAYSYIGYKAVKGLLSLGDFSMCITATNTMTNCCETIVRCFQEILKRVNYANEYMKFMEYPFATPKGSLPVKLQGDHLIEFKNVSFKYPRGEKYVLKNVSITIPSGQHLAVVGLNGAGKTTFIKLLCRLYDVSDGEILIDGINIKEYSDQEYRKLFAVVFQDFKLFRFSLRENISFDTQTADSEIEPLLKESGLYDDVQKMPHKADTMMWKSFDKKGIELSGGQQQKLVLARALYKNAPVVILDEPTAALDPIAEAEVYDQFNKSLAGGKTAIYISHRLSSCKFCDKIAVFDEGELKEYGSHKELMENKGGVYHKMFTTQAEQYIEK